MKPNQISSRKLNLNKQTVQKLDNSKLSTINAGAAAKAGTTTVILSVTVVEITTILCVVGCGVTIG
ncbi:MAG TPA: class I lanthipeptide [Panacibacter sp.]|nr:class I lanthipeptide [Panacibacter sp.]